MSLEDLGNLGDFVGGIAVILSLLYVAFQVRRNTVSVQAATIQSATQGVSEIMELVVRDLELLRLYYSGARDFESLSEEDRFRFASLMGVVLHRYENLVSQTERGLLPAASWEGAANRLRGAFALPGTQLWWKRGKHAFNEELRSWIDDEIIAEPLEPPAAS